jgi:hypothetical protein
MRLLRSSTRASGGFELELANGFIGPIFSAQGTATVNAVPDGG